MRLKRKIRAVEDKLNDYSWKWTIARQSEWLLGEQGLEKAAESKKSADRNDERPRAIWISKWEMRGNSWISAISSHFWAKSLGRLFYQNNLPNMEKNPNNTKFRRFRGHLLWNWGHSWKCGVTSLTLIWPHFLRSPPPAAGHESFYSKSIQFFNCASKRIEKQYVLSCRYLHVLTLEGHDSTELMWNMSKHAKCYFGLCKKGPHLCRP